MIVQIKTRGDNGRYVNAIPSEFVMAAFDHIHDDISGTFRWEWMRGWLSRWCLIRAERDSGNPVAVDKWIDRYRAIRGIQ